jgi:hypothetical protein
MAHGGTCFSVRFPRETELTPSLASPAALPFRDVARPHGSRRLRLLLIDDEPLVLRSLRRMLGEHHVDVAQSGSEALKRLRQDRNFVEKPMAREAFERVVADWCGQRRHEPPPISSLVSA